MTRTYEELESSMLTYRDLLQIPVRENHEPLVPVMIPWGYRPPFTDMQDALDGKLMVRQTVADKLATAQRLLHKQNPSLTLFVCYGYRDPAIQKQRFIRMLRELAENAGDDPFDLYEQVHRRVAVPAVAGHPAGAAVDITIKDIVTDRELDFGSDMYNYATKKFYTFSPDISQSQQKQRILLRNIMMKTGFAPFDGEWWHFSYGDREWACYYKRLRALYGPVTR